MSNNIDPSNTNRPTFPSKVPPVVKLALCKLCGATIEAGMARCWLCHGQQDQVKNPYSSSVAPEVAAQHVPLVHTGPQATSSRFDALFIGILFSICILTVLVGIGIAVQDPGLLVLYIVFMVPPYLAVGIRGLMQVSQSGKARPGSLILTWISSLVVTGAVAVLIGFAMIIMLVIYCFSQLANH